MKRKAFSVAGRRFFMASESRFPHQPVRLLAAILPNRTYHLINPVCYPAISAFCT
jgi:hypothetical protein